MLFNGTGVAIVTPFSDSDNSIDVNGLKKLVHHLIDGQVEYLVALGTTAETATLSPEEQELVVSTIIKENNSKLPIVLGYGGNNTQSMIDQISSVDRDGVDAILIASPFYNKPTQGGILEHYTAIANVSPKPVILYNVPSRTGSNMSASTTVALSKHPNIIGIKEASGDTEQCMEIRRNTSSDFAVISGDDALTHSMMSFGCNGVISVVANAIPKEFSDMVRFGLNDQLHLASKTALLTLPFIQSLFKEGNPAGIKAALQILGICTNQTRLPLLPASDALNSELSDLLSEIQSA